jgi:hypothetical protein
MDSSNKGEESVFSLHSRIISGCSISFTSTEKKTKVFLLESMSGSRQNFYKWILSLKGIEVTEAVFFFGDFKIYQA